jgi:hypothetical protein
MKTYEEIVDEITSLTVDEFESLCEEEGIKDIVPNIDDAIHTIATQRVDECNT